MTLLLVGLALLVAWPFYNLTLVIYTARDGKNSGRHSRAGGNPATGHEPEVFWIVVPCLNEERVVGQTVRYALELHGPLGTRTRVLVVNDGSDDGTPLVLAGIDDPNLHVLNRVLPDARNGKGEALNAAVRYIRKITAAEGTDPAAVAVGVIDGDGRASRNMLTEVSWAMRDEAVGATQSRVRIHNRDKLLAAMQDMEFACIANARQLMRNALGTVGLGGNGQFARLSALDMLGDAPWSACLVEDLEVGLRMHLAGVKIRYISRAAVTQQGLTDVRRLLRQRTRWAQGNLQCIRYVPMLFNARRIPNSALVEMLYYLLAPWANAFGTQTVAILAGVSVGRIAIMGRAAAPPGSMLQLTATVGVWGLAMLAPFLMWGVLHRVQLRDEKLSRCLLAGLCYPGFLFLGLISTYRAIGRQVTGRNSWAKTERLADDWEADQMTESDDELSQTIETGLQPAATTTVTVKTTTVEVKVRTPEPQLVVVDPLDEEPPPVSQHRLAQVTQLLSRT
jgi:1,2-diacylglycerol 3-beta-glucosyltransferase